MKPVLFAATIAVLVAFNVACLAAEAAGSKTAGRLIRFTPVKGRLRIEGTSNIDTWQIESRSIGGSMEVPTDFATHPDPTGTGSLEIKTEAVIEVRSLKSIEKDGKPFSNKMDDIMDEALKYHRNPKITYRLDQLELRSSPKLEGAPTQFQARGKLTVAGVTKEVVMAINVLPLSGNQFKVWGSTPLKMTDFQIDPPAPKIALGLIKTDDEVKLSFEWVLGR